MYPFPAAGIKLVAIRMPARDWWDGLYLLHEGSLGSTADRQQRLVASTRYYPRAEACRGREKGISDGETQAFFVMIVMALSDFLNLPWRIHIVEAFRG